VCRGVDSVGRTGRTGIQFRLVVLRTRAALWVELDREDRQLTVIKPLDWSVIQADVADLGPARVQDQGSQPGTPGPGWWSPPARSPTPRPGGSRRQASGADDACCPNVEQQATVSARRRTAAAKMVNHYGPRRSGCITFWQVSHGGPSGLTIPQYVSPALMLHLGNIISL
jgi:hypothetical protein